MTEQIDSTEFTIGVVGLGLMGSSIVVSLLLKGHTVIALAPVEGEVKKAFLHIKELLHLCEKSGELKKSQNDYLNALILTEDYNDLTDCRIVQECVIEEIRIKELVYKKITTAVNEETIIATNTSAIPISVLQEYVTCPERFLGIHWAEPAFATRFMEITCGSKTSSQLAEWIYDLACYWGKEPILLKKDIRGFITNRLIYAISREVLTLMERGHVSLEDVDKAFRYDAGSWMTLMGIFRRMDFLGLKDFSVVFNNVFPELNNSGEVPAIMQRLVDTNARGIQNCRGLYHYTAEEAKKWETAFAAFNTDIYRLAALYRLEHLKVISKKTSENKL